jgi:hypothetical protein
VQREPKDYFSTVIRKNYFHWLIISETSINRYVSRTRLCAWWCSALYS